MNSETLQKRINSCEENLIKLEKKLSRILKAEKSNYEKDNPYYYSEWDKKSTLREIEETNQKLNNYKEELQQQLEKENSRNVQVIIDFLNQWKDKVYLHYEKDIHDAYEMLQQLRNLQPKWGEDNYKDKDKLYQEKSFEYHVHLHGKYEWKKHTNPYTYREDKYRVKVSEGRWEYLKNYYTPYKLEEGLNKLKKDLSKEADAKYDFIIQRTNKIVGEIVDASNLHIGDNGELNGIIYGIKDKCKVESIGCGGYNIQDFHFRVYVKEIK